MRTMRCVNKVGSLPTHHPSLSIETHSADVYAEANVTQMCLNCLPEARHSLSWVRWWCLLDLNFKSELVPGPSRPEQESDTQRQDSRTACDSPDHVGQSEASISVCWPIRGQTSPMVPLRGWLADREVSAALSGSSSRTFHPCHAIRRHYWDSARNTLTDSEGHRRPLTWDPQWTLADLHNTNQSQFQLILNVSAECQQHNSWMADA